MVARGGEVALVGGDAEAVHLRVGVGDGAGADAAESFPEALVWMLVGWKQYQRVTAIIPNRVVISSCVC